MLEQIGNSKSNEIWERTLQTQRARSGTIDSDQKQRSRSATMDYEDNSSDSSSDEATPISESAAHVLLPPKPSPQSSRGIVSI